MRSIRRTCYLSIWAVIALLAGLSHPSDAHNGAVAEAIPLSGITIDGDLSDWPERMRMYPIAWVHPTAYQSEPPTGPEDLDAHFTAGFDQKRSVVYVAMVVGDEDGVVGLGEGTRDRDLCEVYIDGDHSTDKPVTQQYTLNAGAVRTAKHTGGDISPSSGAQGISTRMGPIAVYEFEIPVFFEDYPERRREVAAGDTIGFDAVVVDADGEDLGNWVAWTPGGGKFQNSALLGDLVFVAEYSRDDSFTERVMRYDPDDFGSIRGTVVWEDPEERRRLGVVSVRRDSGDRVMDLRPDSTGAFQTRLLPGNYRLFAGYRRETTDTLKIAIKAGLTHTTEMYFVDPPIGTTVKAGPGTLTRAGSGTRVGTWQTFSVADGLPSNVVYAVYQDRDGIMWFGTEGGVSRFDGEEFRTLTTRDGLLSDWVHSIVQDVNGHMWFGTGDWTGRGGGVTEYDGISFRNLSRRDGLPHDTVMAVYVDREGNMWFGSLQSGVSRFDGRDLMTFKQDDGLATDWVWGIKEDAGGNLWFATTANQPSRGRGITRFDGTSFTVFNEDDGLAANRTDAAHDDQKGSVWVATEGGISRYDGETFVSFTTDDGLLHNSVQSITEDRNGNLWFGTHEGVSRYDGQGPFLVETVTGSGECVSPSSRVV